jgi:hypothetical protein
MPLPPFPNAPRIVEFFKANDAIRAILNKDDFITGFFADLFLLRRPKPDGQGPTSDVMINL